VNLSRFDSIQFPRHPPRGFTHARECLLGNRIVAKIGEHAKDENVPVRVCPMIPGHLRGVDDTALESTAHCLLTQRGAGFVDLIGRLADLYLDLKAVPSGPEFEVLRIRGPPEFEVLPKIKMKCVLKKPQKFRNLEKVCVM
jgi:hypothetical protein